VLFWLSEVRLAALVRRRGTVIKPELTATPRLAPGVRLNEKNQQPRILITPTREFQLRGPSLEIVQLCDGKHTVHQIAEKLHGLYAKAEPQRVTEDLLNYLALLHDQRAIEF
jgi:Coenzyme PQQ synthesis protein D (PqqD)